ncbi:MAG: hypothetical protein M1838_006277 [Thelocarpon superellum]|nr:MAG: hypothetical protein M1838_006277 [Thelocarpon superellum]
MPSHGAPSFASAAARHHAQDPPSHARSSREDGGGSGDWSRPRGNTAGTATFRRPSHATSTSQVSHHAHQSQTTTPTSASSSNVYVPPHQYQSSSAFANGASTDSRYGKDQLLGIYRTLKDAGELNKDLQSVLVAGWNPKAPNGTTTAGWNTRDESRKDGLINGPEICWEMTGEIDPLGFVEMTDEEREHFTSSVNSPLKSLAQNAGKESGVTNNGIAGRKTSLSHGQNNAAAFPLSSPTSTRPANRRRETSDSLPHAHTTASPLHNGRSFRDDSTAPSPPPLLMRRRTDREGADIDRDQDAGSRDVSADMSTFPSFLQRKSTGPLSATGNAPSSPWSRDVNSFSPMGSFGSFAMTESPVQPATPSDKKVGAGGLRSGSRWSKFMGKEGTDEANARLAGKSSFGSLGKVNETEAERSTQSWRDMRTNRPTSNDSDPFGEGGGPSGSAALGGGQDISPPQAAPRRAPGLGTPVTGTGPRHDPHEMDVGLSGFRDGPQPESHRSNISLQGGHEPLSPTETNPYQSPLAEKADSDDIDTDDSEVQNAHHSGLRGMTGEDELGTFGHIPRSVSSAYENAAADRSQTSSAGATRAFPSLGGLGGSRAWPSTTAALGTPDREKAGFAGAFGGSVFGPMSDLHSPGLITPTSASFGMGAGPGATTTNSGTAGRGSRLGSLFPAAMQAQMHSESAARSRDVEGVSGGPGEGPRLTLATNNPLASAFDPSGLGSGSGARGTDSPMRTSRNAFDDALFAGHEPGRTPGAGEALSGLSAFSQPPTTGASTSAVGPATSHPEPATSQSTSAGPPPPSQQRTMVMPDRMRWIYKDPQGSTQGPWSGLEMHDWFKAGFFSAELLVKKYEDPEYEPLGQLIRRIGNSREPFLVPQIGIPHGPSNGPTSTPWTPGAAPGGNAVSTPGGSVQPPFAGAFPSFGTTLTAEQQNALERRKQEEQYLMARQKEYLAQQQVIQKQMHQIPGAPHAVNPQPLHHHSSAHSLHSQPSFGSITSPAQFHPTPPQQGPMSATQSGPGFFDAQIRLAAGGVGMPMGSAMDFGGVGGPREEELVALLARQNLGRDGQGPGGAGSHVSSPYAPDMSTHPQHIAAMMAQRAQLEREQAQFDASHQAARDDSHQTGQRLAQFSELRSQRDAGYSADALEGLMGKTTGAPDRAEARVGDFGPAPPSGPQSDAYRTGLQMEDLIARAQLPATSSDADAAAPGAEVLSLTQQVQKAASAKHSPALASQAESVWAQAEPKAFPPPPQSISPLPAPAAQRNRQNLPEALTAESRSRQSTPSTETTNAAASIAPWAKESNDGMRRPSLREIQEIEARKAAKVEEVAAAARRAAQEQERLHQPPAAPTQGLPTSSNWATHASTTTPSAAPSAWAKPLAGKNKAAHGGAGMKKTLSQIQREEESRKQRLASAEGSGAMGPAGGASATGASAGKRYADLASKAAMAAAPVPSSGPWMTVGASGKAKMPAHATATGPPPGLRVASSGATSSPTSGKARPTATPHKATSGGASHGPPSTNDEFTRWSKEVLSKGLNSNINVDDFVQQLLMFPPEAEIIAESVYANSQTMDGRRFAEEFLRRRKLAEKGVMETSSGLHNGLSPSTGGGNESKVVGGWNEVAKKVPGSAAKDTEPGSAFKVVAAKKKGRK